MGHSGLGDLYGIGIRGLLHEDATCGSQILYWGEPMTTSNSSNRQTSNLDDAIMNAGFSQSLAVYSALYYPSLAGNCWDDELLPSGD